MSSKLLTVIPAIKRTASTCIPKPALVKPHSKCLPLFDFFAATKPKVSYIMGHGAAGFAKERHLMPSIPMHSSHIQVGEDAYFRRSDAIGVADGIGSWANVAGNRMNGWFISLFLIFTCTGANSALYSSRLMHYANLEMDRFEDIEDPYFFQYNDTSPLDVLQRSYEQSLNEIKKLKALGSTTACIAVLRHDELRVANIGDCGISIIRNLDYIFRSEEQQHAFNFPYQLGISSKDKPQDAQVNSNISLIFSYHLSPFHSCFQ